MIAKTGFDSGAAYPIFWACCVSVSVSLRSRFGRVIEHCTTWPTSGRRTSSAIGSPKLCGLHRRLLRRRRAGRHGVDAGAIPGPRRDDAVPEASTGSPSRIDDTGERGCYRLACIQVEAGAFIAE